MGDNLIPTLIIIAATILAMSAAYAGLREHPRHPLVTTQSHVAAMWFLASTAAFAFTIVFLLAPQTIIALGFGIVGLLFFATGVYYGRRTSVMNKTPGRN